MTEQQLQFRVGLFVIAAGLVAGGLAFRFGQLDALWEKNYQVAVFFTSAPGVAPGIPVRKAGVRIGQVQQLFFDDERGGVTVVLELKQKFPLRKDSEARLVRSLLGDASIEFSAGTAREFHSPGARIEGLASTDPMEIVARMESKVTATLQEFANTSAEWKKVATTVKSLVETNRGTLDQVVARAAESLHQFSQTVQTMNRIMTDPQTEKAIRETIATLPHLVADTRETIAAVRSAVTSANDNLVHLKSATGALASRSQSMLAKLDGGLGHLELMLADLSRFTENLNDPDGSLTMLATDPKLYRNLNATAAALETLLKNMDPVVRDMRIFSDKVARHPELIGVGGALKGSSGLK